MGASVIARSAAEIAAAIGGAVVQGDASVRAGGVSIDSRTLNAGEAFFAIRGETHDGHAFIDRAAAGGASLAVIHESCALPPGMTVVQVADTTSALGALATDERNRSHYKVVAITGSSGKTTVRALTTAALSARLKTASSVGNFNNQWGLPLSMLRLPPSIDVAVLELGMNHAGEIAALTRIAQPDVGVITNVGTAHLGNFPDQRGIAAAKCELLDEMPADAKGVVHFGSPLLMERTVHCVKPLLTFGLESEAALRAEDLGGTLLTGTRFRVRDVAVALNLWGTHAALNALAALGAGLWLGLSIEEMAPSLQNVTPIAGRGQLSWLAGDLLVVDETYNANPGAMDAVLSGLAASDWRGRRVAVLGDMRELGPRASALHNELGAAAASYGIQLLHAVGAHAETMASAARAGGVPAVFTHASSDEASRAVPATLRDGDLVVLKASRGTHLETVLDAVLASRPLQVRA